MFGVDSSELIVVAVLALLFIGPKELPRTMMTVGRWVGQIRGYARHFTAGVENVIREAELEEMDRKWREENERILAAHPAEGDYPDPVMTALPNPTGYAEDEPGLPLEAPAAPDDDPIPPNQRPLP
ncbi:MAG: twin-arginine translocase subunit TatB [Sphingomicrobium sp.]